MSGPRTAKDALLAELLGDMDQLLTRFEQSQKDVEDLRAAIQNTYEVQAGQAARQLEAATDKFGEVTTQSVDGVVSVANEALAKFTQRTNELKSSLDSLATRHAQPSSAGGRPPPIGESLWWFVPIAFLVGVLLGICMAYAALK